MMIVPYMNSISLEQTSKFDQWESSISRDDLYILLGSKTKIKNCTENIKKSISKKGTLHVHFCEKKIGIDDFRLIVNRKFGWNKIKSNDFKIKSLPTKLVFKGKGLGHLVGLCQQVAIDLGKNGSRHQDILYTFFPGTKIKGF
jgi:stage II sporulation protein D